MNKNIKTTYAVVPIAYAQLFLDWNFWLQTLSLNAIAIVAETVFKVFLSPVPSK